MNFLTPFLKCNNKFLLIFIVLFIGACDHEETEPEYILTETECGELLISFDCSSSYYFSPGYEVVFTNKSTDKLDYFWDFGDDSYSDEYSPTHIFEKKQDYKVKLTVTSNCTKKTLVKTIFIGKDTANYAKACFDYTSSFYFETGSTINFTNCSQNATNIEWFFGDGTSSSDTTPTHTYNTEGVYKVKLIVSNFYSADTLTKEIQITKKSSKYIEFNNQLFELMKFGLTDKVSSDIQYKTIRLSLASTEIDLTDLTDSTKIISASGSVVYFEWAIDKYLCPGIYNQFSKAWMIPDYNNESGQTNIAYDLKNGSIEILNTNPLELIYSSDIATIYYKDDKVYNELNRSLSELKTSIKNTQDKRATFTFDQYERLLKKLAEPKFNVLTINEMNTTFNSSKVIVGLRHDVDCHPFKALEMMELEQSYGLKASYYILPTVAYYGKFYDTGVKRNTCMEEVYKQLAGGGNEIGVHNDLLAIMIQKKQDPMEFNRDDLFFYKQLEIPIYGSVAHGSSIASTLGSNFQMFSEFATKDYVTYQGVDYPIGTYSMEEYGFSYEANFVPFNMYFSESGGKWSGNNDLDSILAWLENSKPGDRVQILCHPVWWGKE
ncbi:MAG: PKD domain-containing protein [Salinivirgaceae bacterium]|nr:PKD domain-containing protein [Salinivirgaceae bacterium]